MTALVNLRRSRRQNERRNLVGYRHPGVGSAELGARELPARTAVKDFSALAAARCRRSRHIAAYRSRQAPSILEGDRGDPDDRSGFGQGLPAPTLSFELCSGVSLRVARLRRRISRSPSPLTIAG